MSADVEISLVNTDNRELLRACLASLPAACEGLEWHATVVDNASTDGSFEMVEQEFTWARLIRNARRRGFAANHNQVLVAAVSRYVLVLNEDTTLDPRAVTELVATADARPTLGAVVPVTVGTNGESQPSLVPFPRSYFHFVQTLFGSDKPSDVSAGFPVGSCVLLRTEALQAIGVFDERFFIFFEDTDLGRRLRDAGWEIALAPGARIVHHGHQTVSRRESGGDMDKQMLRSRYLYFRKHRGALTAAVVEIGSRIALALRSAKAFAERDRRHAGHLLELARYNPRAPLPIERDAG